LSLKPTFIVTSSGFPGAQLYPGRKRSFNAYFLFKSPVECAKAGAVLKLNKRLAEILKVNPSTSDLTRVLRVPRTLNFKDPIDPRPVDLELWRPDRRYTLEEMAEKLGVNLSEPKTESQITAPEEPAVTLEEALNERSRFLSAEQRLYVKHLLEQGLFELGSRNQAQMLLTMHFYEQGYSRARIVREVSAFFRDRNNGFSKDWAERSEWVLKNIERGVDNWLKKASQIFDSHGQPTPVQYKALSSSDRAFIDKQRLSDRDKAFLASSMAWILNNKRGDRVIMSARQMYKFSFCNERNYRSKRKLLYDLGILRLDVKHSRDTWLAHEFKVLYKFDAPTLRKNKRSRRTVGDKIERLIIQGMTNTEIRERLPGVSRQRIHSKRRTLDRHSRDILGT
jgi:hypothetical protein